MKTSQLHTEAFTGVINHEMRAPIAMLLLFLTQLRKLVKKTPGLPIGFVSEHKDTSGRMNS